MSIGDLKNNIDKLKVQLRRIKCDVAIDMQELREGKPTVFLPLVHFILLDYSKNVAQYIVDNGFDLYAKSDYRFIESVYKILVIIK